MDNVNKKTVFFFQAEDGIRDFCLSRGFGDVYKRQLYYNQDYIDAKISGTVAYDGIVQGPAIVWALDENDTVVAQQSLPNGNGTFELMVPKLTSLSLIHI